MIKHIVLWKLKDEAEGNTKEENIRKIMNMLLALPPMIPQIKAMEIGPDIMHTEASFDLALAVQFATVEDMRIYIDHPEHRKVSEFVTKVRLQRVIADLEI